MRKKFTDEVEAGRIREGKYASQPGERMGAFRLTRYPLRQPFTAIVSDGSDWEAEGLPGPPWEHVSVSHPDFIPRWDDMCWAKGLFFEDEEAVIQFHPAESVYVRCHPRVLHLWKIRDVDFPLPPAECV